MSPHNVVLGQGKRHLCSLVLLNCKISWDAFFQGVSSQFEVINNEHFLFLCKGASVTSDWNSNFTSHVSSPSHTQVLTRDYFTCANPRKNSCSGVKSKPGSFNSLLFFATQVWYACQVTKKKFNFRKHSIREVF